MTRRILLSVATLIAIGTLAYGQEECGIGDFGCGHGIFHPWYSTGEDGKYLKRPHQPGVSCCDGDCRPTLAKFRDGQWYALIDGQYDPVPNDRIKWNVTAPNAGAHVCAASRTNSDPIVPFCFIPPQGAT